MASDEILASSQNYASTITRYENPNAAEPSLQDTFRYADALQGLGRLSDSVKVYTELLDRGLPSRPRCVALYSRARSHMLAGRIAEAITDFAAACDVEPSPVPLMRFAGALTKCEEYSKALNVLGDALDCEETAQDDKLHARILVEIARNHTALDKLVKARDQLKLALELVPNRRAVKARLKDIRAAIKCRKEEESTATNPGELGPCETIERFKLYFIDKPAPSYEIYCYIESLLAVDRYTEALEGTEQWLDMVAKSRKPDSIYQSLLQLSGRILFEFGNIERAETQMRHAYETEKRIGAILGLSGCLISLERFAEAETLLREGLAMSDNGDSEAAEVRSDILLKLALTLRAQSRYAEALQLLAQLIARDPAYPEAADYYLDISKALGGPPPGK